MPRARLSGPHAIDNPGGGDCGFYAFAIGLVSIIQQEFLENNQSKTLDRWKKLDPNNSSLDQIRYLNLNELARNPRSYQKNLLNDLQLSLRLVACNAYKKDFLNKPADLESLRGSHVYDKFMELVLFYSSSLQQSKRPGDFLRKGKDSFFGIQRLAEFNELALDKPLCELAKRTAFNIQNAIQNAKSSGISPTFSEQDAMEKWCVDQALSEQESVKLVLKAVDNIKAKGRWATDTDLRCIASEMQVNLVVTGEAQGTLITGYPTVTLNNLLNRHWTTSVDVFPAPLTKNSLSEDEQKILMTTISAQKEPTFFYKQAVSDVITGRERIFEEALKAKKKSESLTDGESLSDEELASILQAEELEKAGFKP